MTEGIFDTPGQSSAMAERRRVVEPAMLTVVISGEFTGTVRLERKFYGDGDGAWLPITQQGKTIYEWSTPASELIIPEPGSHYRLRCVSLDDGAVHFRIT